MSNLRELNEFQFNISLNKLASYHIRLLAEEVGAPCSGSMTDTEVMDSFYKTWGDRDDCELRDLLLDKLELKESHECFNIIGEKKERKPRVTKAKAKAETVEAAPDFFQVPTSVTVSTKGIEMTYKTEQEANSAQSMDSSEALVAAIKAIAAQSKQAIDPAAITGMVDAAVSAAVAKINIPQATRLEVKMADGKWKELGVVHKDLPKLIKILGARTLSGKPLNVFLVGGAGVGKTTAASQAAVALNLEFFFNGAIGTKHELMGFVDAGGTYRSTAFRQAWEFGGVYLFDELDGSLPAATLAFNAALANGVCDFPDGAVKRHADCVVIAAGNTYGMGATFDFVGRNKQDGAFMDRFVKLSWDNDDKLELALAGNADWVKYVQRIRKNANTKGIKVIISPRASIHGAALIASGFTFEEAAEMTIRNGMSSEQWSSITL